MDTAKQNGLEAIQNLDAETVRQRLADLEAEQRSLRVILRAVTERDKARQRLAPKGKGAASCQS